MEIFYKIWMKKKENFTKRWKFVIIINEKFKNTIENIMLKQILSLLLNEKFTLLIFLLKKIIINV